jgi:hypothetical protein
MRFDAKQVSLTYHWGLLPECPCAQQGLRAPCLPMGWHGLQTSHSESETFGAKQNMAYTGLWYLGFTLQTSHGEFETFVKSDLLGPLSRDYHALQSVDVI